MANLRKPGTMKEIPDTILDCPSPGIRALLDETAAEDRLWSSDDLRDVFGHQWSAPLAVDLGGLGDAFAGRVKTLAASKGLLLQSFGDLLAHQRPPLELLVLTKEFAKRCLSSPHSALPHDIARVLYFASIAAALSRCSRRITTLGDQRIEQGIAWALSRTWLAEEARAVLEAGQRALKPERHQS